MGMLTLDPASPYMERIKDLLRKKRALGTDDWMRGCRQRRSKTRRPSSPIRSFRWYLIRNSICD